jgi:hypothetical protein
MARNDEVFLVSKRLRELLEEVLLAGNPEDFSGPDDQAIGVALNDWRVVLARLHAVHTSQGRHTGWGTNLEEQVARLFAWRQAQDARAARAARAARTAEAEDDPEIPSDDDESSPPTRRRK